MFHANENIFTYQISIYLEVELVSVRWLQRPSDAEVVEHLLQDDIVY